MSKSDIVIITRDNCRYSQKMRDFLRSVYADFEDRNVSAEGRAVLKEYNAENKLYPAVFFKGRYIGDSTTSVEDPDFSVYLMQNLRQQMNETLSNKY